jgi:hypothetical protein
MIAVMRLKLKNLRVTFAGPRPSMNGLVPRATGMPFSPHDPHCVIPGLPIAIARPGSWTTRYFPNHRSTHVGNRPPATKSP